jgi:imidazolonepropionase-like amidohydrolase
MFRSFPILLSLLVGLPSQQDQTSLPYATGNFAFVDFQVVPMDTERVLTSHTVLVSDGVIQALGPKAEIEVPEGATRIEGGGELFLMPGLVDTHVHFESDEMFDMFLVNGVTSVINLKGSPDHLERRRKVLDGEHAGPTIYTSGPFLNQPEINTADEAEDAVLKCKEAGYDLLKIHGNLTREAFERMAEASRGYEIALTGHAPRNLPFDAVLEVGMVWIVHAEELIYTHFTNYDEKRIPDMARRMAKAGIWLTPTLSTFENIVVQWGKPESVDEARANPDFPVLGDWVWDSWKSENPYTGRAPSTFPERALAFQFPLVKALHDAGVRLMVGTDTPLPMMAPGASMQQELDILKRVGLSDYEVLVAATRHPGEFVDQHLRQKDSFGTVAVGQRADLVLLERNPLEDSRATAKPVGVMARGRWLSSERLEEMRPER